MFIPYRAKIKITRIPVMTLAVSLLCLLVYWAQEKSATRIVRSAETYCTPAIAEVLEGAQRQYIKSDMPCATILLHIHVSGNPERHLAWHVARIEQGGDKEAAQALVTHYHNFVAQAPPNLTQQLVHRSGEWNPLRLLSSAVAHADWGHLTGNLFFFFAFAMVVETVIGPVLFLLVFLAMALGSGVLENLLTATREGGGGLGLSGVVMSMMALAAYLAPRVKIKFFYFFFLMFGFLSWPLWSLAVWYVFWNLWDYYFWRDWSNINYVVHLTGVAMGLILGLAVFREKRHWVQEHLVPDEPAFTDDESWLYKFNVFGATPVVMAFAFFYGFCALIVSSYLIVLFFKTFFVQLLIVAPAVAAMVQIYRLKKPPTPDWERLQQGLRHLERHEFLQAEKIFRPLAERGYPRGQFALGRLFASASGMMRDDKEAFRWFEAAALRGLPEAQYEIGARYFHGLGVGKDVDRSMEWLEKAANKGLPEAASTLAYVYENAPKPKIDREKAIEWYYRAGVGFHKAGRLDDARAMLKSLHALLRNYPAVFQLVAELEKLVEIKDAGR